jgi:hypothetical protein
MINKDAFFLQNNNAGAKKSYCNYTVAFLGIAACINRWLIRL